MKEIPSDPHAILSFDVSGQHLSLTIHATDHATDSDQGVGQSPPRNSVPMVPCHRFLSQSGIGGSAGAVGGEKLRSKGVLLSHEGVICG